MRFQAAIVISAVCCLVSLPAVAAPKPSVGDKPSTGGKASATAKPNATLKPNATTKSSAATKPTTTTKPSDGGPQTASAKEVSALQLDQTHIYLGKLKLLLAQDAVKLVGLGKFRFSLVSKAPEWNVTVYREDDKIYCTQKLNDFYDQGGLFSNLVMVQKERMMPRGSKPTKDKVSGFTVNRTAWAGVVFKSLPVEGNTAPPVERILHAGYKVPTDGQIPISYEVVLSGKDWMTHLSEEGMRRAFLATQKISRKRVSSSEFDIPAGFVKEKSLTRIVVGSEKKMRDTGVGVLFE